MTFDQYILLICLSEMNSQCLLIKQIVKSKELSRGRRRMAFLCLAGSMPQSHNYSTKPLLMILSPFNTFIDKNLKSSASSCSNHCKIMEKEDIYRPFTSKQDALSTGVYTAGLTPN